MFQADVHGRDNPAIGGDGDQGHHGAVGVAWPTPSPLQQQQAQFKSRQVRFLGTRSECGSSGDRRGVVAIGPAPLPHSATSRRPFRDPVRGRISRSCSCRCRPALAARVWPWSAARSRYNQDCSRSWADSPAWPSSSVASRYSASAGVVLIRRALQPRSSPPPGSAADAAAQAAGFAEGTFDQSLDRRVRPRRGTRRTLCRDPVRRPVPSRYRIAQLAPPPAPKPWAAAAFSFITQRSGLGGIRTVCPEVPRLVGQ